MLTGIQNITQSNYGVRENFHQPVMVSEVLSILRVKEGGVFLDCTLGLGGHASAILSTSEPDGVVIGIDCDEDALEIAKKNLMRFKERFTGIYGNFKEADKILKELNINSVDGILLDLGFSSFQVDNPERGFSFMRDGPLDMRMDKNNPVTAEEVVNNYGERELERIIREYGEERYARRIAKKIVEMRRKFPIKRTLELVNIIESVVPAGRRRRHGAIHPATRTFQALRIAVNQEIENLRHFFSFALNIMKRGARIVVISFHSLEDRLVKLTFRQWAKDGVFNILTPGIIRPSDREISANPRARSAKLRAGEKIL